MTIELDKLASGTTFKLGTFTYKKGTIQSNTEVECTPKLGGQWQPALKEFFQKCIQVSVNAD